MQGRRDGIEDAMASAEDWEDLAARLADWGVRATGEGGRIAIRALNGDAEIGVCARPPALGPAEAHFLG